MFNQPSTLNGRGVKQPKTNPFLPVFGLFVRKMPSARFGHLLISRACDIIKFVGLKKIISYGKVQAKSKIWQETLPFGESGWGPVHTPTG